MESFERYVTSHPEDADAFLAYADAEIYRGNYARAEYLQDCYRRAMEDGTAFRKARANLRARSGRPTEALALLDALPEDPRDEYDRHSDGNRRWEVTLAPRRAVRRTQRLNLDLGLRAQAFHYEEDAPGYYDPDSYLRLWAVAYGYWKLSDNDGIGIVLSGGPERDRDLDDRFKLGAGGAVEGTFGIYRDWQIRVHAAYNWRAEADAIGGGGFNGRSGGIEILRRF